MMSKMSYQVAKIVERRKSKDWATLSLTLHSFGAANGSSDGSASKWKQTKLNFGSFVASPGFGGNAFATTSVMAPRMMKAEPGKKHIDIMVSGTVERTGCYSESLEGERKRSWSATPLSVREAA